MPDVTRLNAGHAGAEMRVPCDAWYRMSVAVLQNLRTQSGLMMIIKRKSRECVRSVFE